MVETRTPPSPPTLAGRLRAACSSRLARDSAAVLVLGGAGRVAALGKELLVAYFFGVSAGLDAYLLALLAPAFLVNLLGASFSSALIPALARLRAEGDEAGARAALGQGLTLLAGVLLAATLFLALVPAQALRPLSPLADAARLEEIKALQLALAPVCLLGGLANVLAALANLRGSFRLPALAGVANTLLALLLLAAGADSLGVRALVLGLDAGYALETLLLALLVRRTWGPPAQAPLSAAARAALAQAWRNYGVMALGAGVMGLTVFVDNGLVSLAGEGAVSALGYAGKLPSIVTTLGAATLATVLLPHFATAAHTQSPQEFWDGFLGLLKALLLLVTPLALCGALFSRQLVALAFQRGGFDAGATELVAGIQAFSFLQLPFYLGGVACGRVLQALGQHHVLLGIATAMVPLSAGLGYVLLRLAGARGIALSGMLVYATSMALCLYMVRRHHGRMRA